MSRRPFILRGVPSLCKSTSPVSSAEIRSVLVVPLRQTWHKAWRAIVVDSNTDQNARMHAAQSDTRYVRLALAQALLWLALGMTGAAFAAATDRPEQPGEADDPSLDQRPDSATETLRELERETPATPESSPSPQSRQKEKAQEQLRRLEERRAKDKAAEREQQTPQERAREKVRQLEQTAPADEAPPQGLSLDPRDRKRERTAGTPPARRAESKERVKELLGVYESQIGIYDEILDKTKVGPGLLHDALRAPRWLVLGGEHRTRYEGLSGSWRMNEPDGGQLLSMRTRLQVGVQNILDPVRFLIEIQDSRAPLTTTGSYITTDHVNELDIQQLHLDLVSSNFLGTRIPTVLKVGRINMEMGRGRWVGRNWFRNTTNAFDGISWQLGDERQWQFRSFLVQPVQRFPVLTLNARPLSYGSSLASGVNRNQLAWAMAQEFHRWQSPLMGNNHPPATDSDGMMPNGR